MFIFRIGLALLAGTLMVGPRVRAANIITISSTFFSPGQRVPQSCRDQATMLKWELSSFPLPDQWNWYIVCDDASWQRLMRNRDGVDGGPIGFVESIYASTDITAHITFLRGTMFTHPDDLRANPDHVLAHELGHILLHTENEDRAEREALRLLSSRVDSPLFRNAVGN